MKITSRLFMAALAASGVFVATVPAHAQNAMAGRPAGAQTGAAQDPLIKGITLNADQKTKYTAVKEKYKAEAMKVQQQVMAKYGPEMQQMQQMQGTNEEKQAKAKPLMKKIVTDTVGTMKSMVGRMVAEVDGIMTPAQKPQFNKNKAALMAQMDQQIKAQTARFQ